MQEYDAIVIGLGPAGSTTARRLASAGRRVLALEKASGMPRPKPCGGCLSARIRRYLDSEITRLAEEEIRRVLLTFGSGYEISVETEEPLAYMVSRPAFDQHLARQAVDAGAEVRFGQAVRDLLPGPGGVEVVTDTDRYLARVVVGADGVNGVTARCLGAGGSRRTAVAYEVEARVPGRILQERAGTIQLDLGAIAHGYAWVFPKSDHLSLGVGTMERPIRHPRQDYERLIRDHRLPVRHEVRQGYRIPIFSGGAPRLVGPGWVRVGDAAALADPLLGEGIYYAVVSARAAARAIDAALSGASRGDGGLDLSAYQKWAQKQLFPELVAAQRLASLPYRYPRLAFALLTASPEEALPLAEVLQGRRTYRDCWSHLWHQVLKAPMALWRSSRYPGSRDGAANDTANAARHYAAADFLWKETEAGAWHRFMELVTLHTPPGAAVLDARARTGTTAFQVRRQTQAGPVVACDPSTWMLGSARQRLGRGAELVRAHSDHLPFPDGRFDVVCAWLFEPGAAPRATVAECLRVLKEDGVVVCAFPTRPGGRDRLYAWMLECVSPGLSWRFLDAGEQSRHECDGFETYRFRNGMMTVAVLRKCCTVDAEVSCRRATWALGLWAGKNDDGRTDDDGPRPENGTCLGDARVSSFNPDPRFRARRR